jgi:hypothetical protein
MEKTLIRVTTQYFDIEDGKPKGQQEFHFYINSLDDLIYCPVDIRKNIVQIMINNQADGQKYEILDIRPIFNPSIELDGVEFENLIDYYFTNNTPAE